MRPNGRIDCQLLLTTSIGTSHQIICLASFVSLDLASFESYHASHICNSNNNVTSSHSHVRVNVMKCYLLMDSQGGLNRCEW